MSDQDIALTLMNAARTGTTASGALTPAGPTLGSRPPATQPTTAPATAPADTAPADVSSQSTGASVAELAAEARASLTDPKAVFEAVADDMNHDWKTTMVFQGDADRQAFEAAYASGQVTYQNASDIEGLDYQDHTTLTGTGGSHSSTYNVDWRVRYEAETGTYTNMICFPIVGAIFMSYPKRPDTAAAPTA